MTPEETTQKICDTTMSPFCPGLTLSGCPSQDATTLKFEILKDLTDGKSELQVQEILYKRYGSQISGLPVGDKLFWIIPFLLVIVLLIPLKRLFKKNV